MMAASSLTNSPPEAYPYYQSIRVTFTGDYDVEHNGELANLGRVNFFVGQNNAGKSRFLRALLTAQGLEYKPSYSVPPAIISAINELHQLVLRRFNELTIVGYGPIPNINAFANFAFNNWYSRNINPVATLKKQLQPILDTKDIAPVTTRGNLALVPEVERVHVELQAASKSLLHQLDPIPVTGGEPRIYIPSLRGLRPLGVASDDHYKNRTTGDYKLNEQSVFTGYQLYSDTRNLLLGSREERERVREYEDFLSKEIFGKHVELIPHRDSDVLRIRIGDNEEHPSITWVMVFQSMLALTFPAMVANTPTIFFFEEPETHLHPGLQRRILELFLTHPKLMRHQIFATTHSNHYLDLSADYEECVILLFKKRQTQTAPFFSIRTMSHEDRVVLQELGVRTSSVFLTNATIWVEGITDRLYLREFLACYIAEFYHKNPALSALREDVHYSFTEIGGANAVHFTFDPESDDFGD